MDSRELKEEVKSIIRARCEELGLEYFENEEVVANIVLKKAKQKQKETAELKQLEREIQERKRANQEELTQTHKRYNLRSKSTN